VTTVRTLNTTAPQPPEKIGRMSPDRHFQSTGWTFLSNHAYVLIELHANPEQVLREVATRVGITERAVQRIVHELEEEGYLTHERVGRRNRYRVVTGKSLRHPLASHKTIEALVQLLISGPEKGRATEPAICQE
jgi:predicted transcriptional regulator